jgi:hypothetical protein
VGAWRLKAVNVETLLTQFTITESHDRLPQKHTPLEPPQQTLTHALNTLIVTIARSNKGARNHALSLFLGSPFKSAVRELSSSSASSSPACCCCCSSSSASSSPACCCCCCGFSVPTIMMFKEQSCQYVTYRRRPEPSTAPAGTAPAAGLF